MPEVKRHDPDPNPQESIPDDPEYRTGPYESEIEADEQRAFAAAEGWDDEGNL